MKNLNEHISRMRSLIDSKHGIIKPMLKEDQELEKKKEEDAKKQKELEQKKQEEKRKKEELLSKKDNEQKKVKVTYIDFISGLDKICDDYDKDNAKDLEDFMEDNFTTEEQEQLKNKILNLIKSCQI
jgi:hypothetical protein